MVDVSPLSHQWKCSIVQTMDTVVVVVVDVCHYSSDLFLCLLCSCFSCRGFCGSKREVCPVICAVDENEIKLEHFFIFIREETMTNDNLSQFGLNHGYVPLQLFITSPVQYLNCDERARISYLPLLLFLLLFGLL